MIKPKKHITCPNCRSANIFLTPLSTTQDNLHFGLHKVYWCSDCVLGFTHPHPNPKKTFLAPDLPYTKLSPLYRTALSFFLKLRHQLVSQILKTSDLSTKNILDVGGGACQFANYEAEQGANVTVIEPNIKNKKFASQSINFIALPFNRAALSRINKSNLNRFDLITMWHVLEHCPKPQITCQLAHELLKKRGHLLIIVPNFVSLQSKIGKNYWAYLDVPHHLFHFSPDSLDKILHSQGFVFKKTLPFSLEYDLFGWQQTLVNLLTFSHNYFYNKTKKNLINHRLNYPAWTKFVSVFQWVLLPLTFMLSIASAISNRPSCLICVYQKKN